MEYGNGMWKMTFFDISNHFSVSLKDTATYGQETLGIKALNLRLRANLPYHLNNC